ncbi:MAG: GNAT family N-acetyltransferase [Defluviitaleaceae bacterium]|nr:GNAT family N-acetyltransferase [Defluviitaleaceae bacterium]
MEINLRKATIDDIADLIRLRIDFLSDGKKISREEESAIRAQLEGYFSKHIPCGTFVGILAETGGQIVSTAYLAVSERPANTSFITGIVGTILNVYTHPDYRKKGIATKVIARITDEAKRIGVSHIELQATAEGKPLYAKMGFTEPQAFTAMGLRVI